MGDQGMHRSGSWELSYLSLTAWHSHQQGNFWSSTVKIQNTQLNYVYVLILYSVHVDSLLCVHTHCHLSVQVPVHATDLVIPDGTPEAPPVSSRAVHSLSMWAAKSVHTRFGWSVCVWGWLGYFESILCSKSLVFSFSCRVINIWSNQLGFPVDGTGLCLECLTPPGFWLGLVSLLHT